MGLSVLSATACALSGGPTVAVASALQPTDPLLCCLSQNAHIRPLTQVVQPK